MIKKTLAGLSVAALLCAGAAFAQGIKRTPLQKIEFPEGYMTVTGIAESPGRRRGRAAHPSGNRDRICAGR